MNRFPGTACRSLAYLLFGCSLTAPVVSGASEVLVYYANETAPEGREAASFDTIIGWLQSGDDQKHAEIAGQLERDRRVFAAAVDVEMNTFICDLPHIDDGPQAVIFTNRLGRRGKCLMWRDGWDEFRDVEFPVRQHDNYIVSANPLSDPKTMRDVLAFVSDKFPPDTHEFVLVVKSHGSGEKAITPRLVVRAEETNREELLRVAADEVGEDQPPQWAGKLGISKKEFFKILGDAKIRFSLVYWEACKALSEESLPPQLPDNVDCLLLIAKNAHFINLVYGDIFAHVKDGERMSDAMLHNLPAKFIRVGDGAPNRWPLWVYFVPLGLFVVWTVRQWMPWCRKKPRTLRRQDAPLLALN